MAPCRNSAKKALRQLGWKTSQKKAHVAKGTIYLHFADKDTLFEEIVKTRISPLLSVLETKPDPRKSLRKQIEEILIPVALKISDPDTSSIIRLLISEGQRFPHLSEMYYRLVVKRGMTALSQLLSQDKEHSPTLKKLAEFPQLLIAPGLTGMIWKTLFDPYQNLDLKKMLIGYLDILFPDNSNDPAKQEDFR